MQLLRMLDMKQRGANVWVFVFLPTLCACSTTPLGTAKTPLSEYVREYRFEEFTPPRSADGLGTIIAFESSQESIIFRRDACLPAEKVPSLDRASQKVAVLEGAYEIDRNATLELELSRALMERAVGVPVDLGATIGTNGIQKIRMTFIDPFRDAIEKGKAKDVVRAYPREHTCREELTRPGNLVIHTVLGARGIKYSFVGEGGASIQVTSSILDQMKVSPAFKAKWSGQFGFDVTGDLLIGYFAWKAVDVSGAFDNSVDFVDLTPAELEKAKYPERR